MSDDPLLLVGRVAGAFGVRGELRLTAYTADPLALADYGPLLREDGAVALTLAAVRPQGDAVVARAPEVSTREQAEALKGLKLHVRRSALPPEEDEDAFYVADLIGLAVVGVDGAPFGRVRAVDNFGAGDLIEVDPGEGRPTWYLPFTREAVPLVEPSAGRITAAPPTEGGDGEPEG